MVRELGRVSHLAFAAAIAASGACGGTTRLEQPPSPHSGNEVEAGTSPPRSAPDVDDGEGAAPVMDDASAECNGDWVVPDSLGFVAANSNTSGITGRWSLYTDCDDYGALDAGTPLPGMNCSLVTAPAPGALLEPDATGAICTTGSTVQVLSDDEWGTRWGAYVALDLQNIGGVDRDFDAPSAGVIGFCIYVSGVTIPTFRVRLASDQAISGRDWYQETLQHEGWHRVLFRDLLQVTPTSTPFDPSKVLSIEIEIPASRLEAIPWDFCVEGLVAIKP